MPRAGYVVRVIGKTNSETVCDIAVAQDFAARYGEGVHRGLSLGGGGLFTNWQAKDSVSTRRTVSWVPQLVRWSRPPFWVDV